jgi:hypothetical protein
MNKLKMTHKPKLPGVKEETDLGEGWNKENKNSQERRNRDREGKKVLFIEEIQSDWHQAGRKRDMKSLCHKT